MSRFYVCVALLVGVSSLALAQERPPLEIPAGSDLGAFVSAVRSYEAQWQLEATSADALEATFEAVDSSEDGILQAAELLAFTPPAYDTAP